jgi:hypothetical protein
MWVDIFGWYIVIGLGVIIQEADVFGWPVD